MSAIRKYGPEIVAVTLVAVVLGVFWSIIDSYQMWLFLEQNVRTAHFVLKLSLTGLPFLNIRSFPNEQCVTRFPFHSRCTAIDFLSLEFRTTCRLLRPLKPINDCFHTVRHPLLRFGFDRRTIVRSVLQCIGTDNAQHLLGYAHAIHASSDATPSDSNGSSNSSDCSLWRWKMPRCTYRLCGTDRCDHFLPMAIHHL